MRSVISSLVVALALAASIGCSSSSGGDNPGGDKCCPIDKAPSCCMNYGGARNPSYGCGETCDEMPYPGDPAWKIVKDDQGCDIWTSVGSTGPKCGAALDTGVDVGGDTRDGGDTSETGDGGGHCCKPDPAPGCCMAYGGWTSGDELACSKACDGMPYPGDPAWKLVKDEHGCDVWSSAGSTGPKCGAAIDSGTDTSSDADAHD